MPETTTHSRWFSCWLTVAGFGPFPCGLGLTEMKRLCEGDPRHGDLLDDLDCIHAAFCHDTGLPRVSSAEWSPISPAALGPLAGLLFGGQGAES
ncbi:hypothetical protein [Kribbella sp. NPDC051137]|uniref:hypothetical protein n=1 Tax=Kribbella sp. NPDC051137 TaxID=3155045 RepID=UPI003423BDED